MRSVIGLLADACYVRSALACRLADRAQLGVANWRRQIAQRDTHPLAWMSFGRSRRGFGQNDIFLSDTLI